MCAVYTCEFNVRTQRTSQKLQRSGKANRFPFNKKMASSSFLYTLEAPKSETLRSPASRKQPRDGLEGPTTYLNKDQFYGLIMCGNEDEDFKDVVVETLITLQFRDNKDKVITTHPVYMYIYVLTHSVSEGKPAHPVCI